MFNVKKLLAGVARAVVPIAKAAAPTIAVAVLTHQAFKPALVKVARDAAQDVVKEHLG